MGVPSLLPAALAGLFFGFIASVGVGPVNLTVVEFGVRRGFRAAFMAGVGAISAETVYAVVALTGYAHLLADHHRILLSLRFIAICVVVLLGLRYLLSRPREDRLRRPAERLDERWHHPKAFTLGFLVTITNLTLLLLWATLAAMAHAHGWVDTSGSSRTACAAGVFLGGLTWYALVASFVSKAHHVITVRGLTILQRITGVILLGFAGYLVVRGPHP